MQEFIAFSSAHWFMWLIWFWLFAAIIWLELHQGGFGVPKLTPQQLVQAINSNQAIVLDVRASDIYCRNHILGAKNIQSAQLLTPESKYHKFKAKRKFVLVGEQEQDVLKIANRLRKMGYADISVLGQGMKAWFEGGFPTVTIEQEKQQKKQLN